MPVRVEEYAGFIYVNLDSQAGTVEDQLPGLGAKVREACPQVDDLKLAARFVTRTPANWKNIVDNYLECYHCGPAHPGFADSVQVDRYWHTLHGNWTLQFGYARPSEQSFKFEEGKEASFHGIWLWPCTMFNMPPLEGMMTVIYEFPVDAETTLQHYDIYFTNADLSDEQLKLIDWYRDVFRPEDLRLVESVQKASNRAAIAAGAHHGRRRRQRRQRTRHRPLPQSAGAGLSTLMRRGPRALTCEVLCEYFRSGAIPPTSLHQRAMARCRQPGNPAGERSATGQLIGSVPNMATAETQRAIDAAQQALEGWRALPAQQRAQLLRRWFELMLEHQQDLASLMTLEQGKPLAESLGEIRYAASFIEWFAEQAKRTNGDIIPRRAAINA